MKITKPISLKLVALAICCLGANAFAKDLCVTVQGPGGHSSGNYGNTSAVHAAARAILQIRSAVPEAKVVDFNGGSTVNAIAAEASFKVKLTGTPEQQAKEAEAVKLAVSKGCDAENAFRDVKAGEMENGLRKDIRCMVE